MSAFKGDGRMADTRAVDLALVGRPGAGEIAGVLMACAVVFVLLVRFDGGRCP